ncbi:MAG TPA: acetyl-CoA carboxylase biotin carboxyl carrier protein [Elusimicrobia bacterium]|nr:acetyl-CoA carboxylase biotin carboxyl carrier protein [Elusimicrobiota bacterium]
MAKRTKETAGAARPEALDELKALYQFMKDNGLERFELDRQDYKVRLVRQGRATLPVPVPIPVSGGAVATAAAPSAVPAAAAALPANAYVMKSPMMGIFYRAASPSSPPFAKEGDTVKPGDVLCLIEAMKVFNDIKAEAGGVVLRVCVENGKPVKAGQDLFIIEKR